MLEICAIASGSNGNCYYIGNGKDAILIDAGISCKQIVLRMNERGLDPAKLKAVFYYTRTQRPHERSPGC